MRQCCSQLLDFATVIARQQQAVVGRLKTEISVRQQAPERALNSAHGRSSAKTILLHFMMVRLSLIHI